MASNEKVIAALLTTKTQQEAAKVAGVSERTIYNLLQDAAFMNEYNEARHALIADAATQAQKALSSAIAALRDIVNDYNYTAGARVSAARALLEYGLRLTEISDINARLDELEKRAESGTGAL